MNTEFGEKLRNVITLESLVWKDKNGNNIKLMTAPEEDIQTWYKHCYEMLYNATPWSLGKYLIRENIQKTWDACNTELFVRYLLHDCNTDIKTKKDLLDYINAQRANYDKDILSESISLLFNGLDPIYEKITIGYLLDACLDKLSVLNKKLITDKFILAQGIWLTDEESLDLTETDEDGNIKDKTSVIKERLGINPDVTLRIDPKGISFNEFRSVVQLGRLPKISLLSSITLKTLRDKVLLLLDNDLNYHIKKWKTLMTNIQKVAAARNIVLPAFEQKNKE